MSLRDALKIPASEITDESVYRERRRLLAALSIAPAMTLSGCGQAEPPAPPKVAITPGQARSGFRTDETPTRYEDITTYNNFYEFGTGKADPSKAKRTLRTSPWTVAVGGHCAKPGKVSLEDLLKGFTPEERAGRW
jgi:methionine sulfoxide reductase catalytic subunit